MKLLNTFWLILFAGTAIAQQDWQPVTGAAALTDFISDRTFTWQDDRGEQSGEYRADGTSTVRAWGTVFERRWEVRGDDQLCFFGDPEDNCNRIERNTGDPTRYRVTNVDTGVSVEVRLTSDAGGEIQSSPSATGNPNAGSAASPSADELAAKLSNPANPVMKLGNNFDFTSFDGDLPGASDQSGFRYLFLTVFPFKLDNGNSFLIRPGLPLVFEQPVPDGQGGYDEAGTDIGDLAYDLIYSGTTKTGTIWGYGVAGSMPVASDDRLGSDLWGLGPEVLYGKAGKWGAAGFLLAHQWDVAGSGSGRINTTTLNYFYGIGIGGGWQLSAAPTISYNHEATSGNQADFAAGRRISKDDGPRRPSMDLPNAVLAQHRAPGRVRRQTHDSIFNVAGRIGAVEQDNANSKDSRDASYRTSIEGWKTQ